MVYAAPNLATRRPPTETNWREDRSTRPRWLPYRRVQPPSRTGLGHFYFLGTEKGTFLFSRRPSMPAFDTDADGVDADGVNAAQLILVWHSMQSPSAASHCPKLRRTAHPRVLPLRPTLRNPASA